MKALINEYWIKNVTTVRCSVEIHNTLPQHQSLMLQNVKSNQVHFDFMRQKAGELWHEEGTADISFGAEHYLSWLSNLRPESDASSEGVSRTGLTNPSNSVFALSSGWVLTKSFSHSSALESSEAEVGPLFICLPPGLRAARRMSSSVRDLSQAGSARLIPAKQGHELSFWQQKSVKSQTAAGGNLLAQRDLLLTFYAKFKTWHGTPHPVLVSLWCLTSRPTLLHYRKHT